MPANLRQKIGEFLNKVEVILQNTINDENIFSKVSQFGYTMEKINEGIQLYQRAVELNQKSYLTRGEQQNKTEELYKALKTAQVTYQNLSKVAKAIFKNKEGYLVQIGLNKRMPTRIYDFISASYTLFDNALKIEEIKSELSKYGYNEAKLLSEREKLDRLNELYNLKAAAKGDAEQTTQEKYKAFEELNNWISQYIKIARVALNENKELLEKLGIKVKPRGRRKKEVKE